MYIVVCFLQLPISPDSTNDPRCLKDCSNARQKTLCGTDDRTYSSNCELKRVKACLGRKTKIKHKGPCVAGKIQIRHDLWVAIWLFLLHTVLDVYILNVQIFWVPKIYFNHASLHRFYDTRRNSMYILLMYNTFSSFTTWIANMKEIWKFEKI